MKFIPSTASISFASMAGLLSMLSFARADRVFWTLPANNSVAYPGCDLELGFRVQYSDIAMLSYVQLQVLDFQDNIVIENVDNSTRQEWDQHRAKNLTWSVPQDWSSGDYILRAFGGATYPCTENGQRKFCRLQLEDRQIIHLQPLPAGATCPVNAFPENTDPSTAESEDGSSNTSDGKESEGSLMDMFDVDRSEVLRLLGEKVGGVHLAQDGTMSLEDGSRGTPTGANSATEKAGTMTSSMVSGQTSVGLAQKQGREQTNHAAKGKSGMAGKSNVASGVVLMIAALLF
ncbi:hypothetical protein BC939DRAFT_147061 [Gamsiella multidivaricata]|uniref:uncharacterized protein n=1 Tax=Gamsiella multidivaricata TaxID=101098 RepID=UPI00221F83D8|nr:uncharacterized protein BC939DRAFT_147061 [Gamsiella multidivaricata]KAI7831683.1 hypothetical protein BC939DRAFT_147061 [Gamsiella multidivaricata]